MWKLINKLKRKINAWNEYSNPIYHWWKARKYFQFPYIKFYMGKPHWFFGFPINKKYINPFIDIRSSAVGWKDKYDSPRHEWNPYISITFFRKFRLLWIFTYCNDRSNLIYDTATWEAILDYIYYNKNIEQCIKNNTWGETSTEYRPCVKNNIKK